MSVWTEIPESGVWNPEGIVRTSKYGRGPYGRGPYSRAKPFAWTPETESGIWNPEPEGNTRGRQHYTQL